MRRFFFVIRVRTPQCKHALESFEKLCFDIKIPIKPSKTVHRTTVLTFLGIELDTVKMEGGLPLDKVHTIKQLLAQFLSQQKVTLKELQSLLGVLNFATKVIYLGRPFIRRIINLTRGLQKTHRHLRLNQEVEADLAAWKLFIDSFNGVDMFPSQFWESSAQLHFFTYGRGLGFGAYFGNE